MVGPHLIANIVALAKGVSGIEKKLVELDSKINQIHALVNSNLSAAKSSELVALESSVRLAKEIIGLKRAAGVEPSEESFTEIDAIQTKINKLLKDMTDKQR